jgi:hypothetical protein
MYRTLVPMVGIYSIHRTIGWYYCINSTVYGVSTVYTDPTVGFTSTVPGPMVGKVYTGTHIYEAPLVSVCTSVTPMSIGGPVHRTRNN